MSLDTTQPNPDQPLDTQKRGSTIDLKAVRARLQSGTAPHVWRSLEEVAETPEFHDYLHREFPSNASEWLDPVGRRGFLKLMSASMALAGVTACTVQPQELIVPYVRQPEEEIPGKPLFFATAMTLGGVASGLLVESHEGRPTKIEGNPDHPASKGATDLFAQGSILTLYDPDRSKTILELGEIRPWSAAIAAIRGGLSMQSSSKGAGLRILTETVASPTLAAQIQQVLALNPGAKWIQWDPVNRDNARAGARTAFGQYVEPHYDLTQADVILSLDADFLSSDGPHNLHYMRQFASRRRVDSAEAADTLSRLYVVESNHTLTGGRADNRLPLKSSQIEAFARAVAAGTGASGVSGAAPAGSEAFATAVANDLTAHKGRAVVMVGDSQPPAVHAIAHAINAAIGAPVTYLPTPEVVPSEQTAALVELVADINASQVQMLVIIGESNPVYSAPADLKFVEAIQKVSLVVHSGLFFDETATYSKWHIPAAHYLEAWSDARTIDGTVSIVQPLIQPLYGGKSAHELIATLTERPERNGYDVVREYWQANSPTVPTVPAVPTAGSASTAKPATTAAAAPAAAPTAAEAFEKQWRKWLHDGFIEGSAGIAGTTTVAPDVATRVAQSGAPVDGIEVNFRRDPTIYDGRFANNGWLQELPKPMTKLTWDNAALIAPATAEAHELASGDIIAIQHDGRTHEVPVWIIPGHAKDSITLTVGYGRTRAGAIGNGMGFNACALRGSSAPFFGAATISKTGDDYELAGTQDHWALEHTNILRSATREEFKANPAFVKTMEHGLPKGGGRISLYPDVEYRGQQWGMAIDLNTCTGCGACVIACVAENNIPVVGKAQVKRNREMHWLRIDRYFAGPADTPDTYYQPMPCQQCENAPCEVVCPVSATVHSAEGLNDMIYNRCVGTRYCSNNCPWKVRRFNFLLYQDWNTSQFKLQRNPDVTVRSRGIMEKCTYCVQRINAARIQAKREEVISGQPRPIRDGDIVTACQAVCPTEAIVFGDINDPNSRVARLKASPRNYTTLEDLNTRPRTTYLAAVKNPNPAMPHNAMVGAHHDTTHEANEGSGH
jgi:MoCo/4Fe-4S cofactor protein with predicted Tat translocation signal